jgi:hypothetical protein
MPQRYCLDVARSETHPQNSEISFFCGAQQIREFLAGYEIRCQKIDASQ